MRALLLAVLVATSTVRAGDTSECDGDSYWRAKILSKPAVQWWAAMNDFQVGTGVIPVRAATSDPCAHTYRVGPDDDEMFAFAHRQMTQRADEDPFPRLGAFKRAEVAVATLKGARLLTGQWLPPRFGDPVGSIRMRVAGETVMIPPDDISQVTVLSGGEPRHLLGRTLAEALAER